MKRKIIGTAMAVLATIGITLVSCSEDYESYEEQNNPSSSQLDISVSTPEMSQTRGLIEGTTLPGGSKIGISLTNSSGENYDNKQYNNIEWTASGTGASQTWASASNILLSATAGNVYAYYPYSSSVTSMETVPVITSSQTDYMYAIPATGIYDGKRTAQLTMKHALAAVRLSIKKGNYTGTCNVTSVSVKGNAVATGATLNAKTGILSNPTGANTAISLSRNFTASSTAQNVDMIVVPSGTSSQLTFTITIDGKSYTSTTTALSLLQGNIYSYNLTVNASSLSISGVTIDSWNYTDSGDLFLDLGYKVYVKGNTSDIAFNNTVSNGVLTMKAVPITYGKQVKTVTTTGTATITQPVDETTGMRTITVSALKSDVTLTFNGIDYNVVVGGNTTGLTWTKNTAGDGTVTIAATPTVQGTKVKEVSGSGSGTLTQTLNEITGVRTITIKNIGSTYTVTFAGCEDIDPWKDVTANGIYYVAADGSKADSPSSSCIGIVLVTGKHRFMIEKNEDKNAIYKTVAQQLGSSNTYTFSWGGYGTDQPDIPTYTGTGGGFSDSGNYLPHEDGSYSSSSYQMNGDYTTWTTGAVSDFNGKANSEVIKGITTNGSSSSTNTPMGILMNTFNSTANANYGYTDWYIPSCGQLALMFRKMQSINNALNAISGQPLASVNYWSSSEYSSNFGWRVYFFSGLVSNSNKNNYYRVRFVRDI